MTVEGSREGRRGEGGRWGESDVTTSNGVWNSWFLIGIVALYSATVPIKKSIE